MKTTIVIPTFNRFDKLFLTLKSINNQTYNDFSVIVMDDGSPDSTVNKYNLLKANLNYSLTIYSQVNSGASEAINNAVSKVKDGLIILFDDDIILSEDTVEKHVAHHVKFNNTLLSGPAYVDKNTMSTDVEKYKVFMEENWRKKSDNKAPVFKVTFENFLITTANMSFSKEIFDKIGGFDKTLRDGYDFEFGLRALDKNIESYFDTSISVIHNDRITLRYYAKRQKCYMDSKNKIFFANPKYKALLKNEYSIYTPFIKKIIYYILRLNLIVNFMEDSKILLILPKKIRYKIYGSTIAALSLKRT